MNGLETHVPHGVPAALLRHAGRPVRFVSRHRFMRDVAILTGGSLLAQALPIVFTPALTRLYSPADIGTLGLFTSFINFASGSATLGYSLAIVSAKDDKDASVLTALSGLVVVPMALAQVLALFMLIRAEVLGLEQLPYWSLAAMVPGLILTGVYTSLRYWMIRSDDYRGISLATVAQSIGRIVVQVGAGLLGLGTAGLLFGEVTGRGAGLRKMYAMSAERLRPFRDTMWSASRLRVVAVSYRKFPLVSAPSQTLNGIALALPVPLVATYFGIIPAGQYAVATRIMILPMSLIGMSVSDVFHQRIADMSRTNPERAVRFLLRALLSLFVLALVPALIVTIGGEELFVFVLGPDWRLAGSIAVAVVPWVVAQFSVSPLSRIAVVYQGQESQLFYNLLHIANIVGVMAFGNVQGWSLIRICTVLSWAQAGIYGVYFLMLLAVVHKNLLINFQQGAGPGEDADDV